MCFICFFLFVNDTKLDGIKADVKLQQQKHVDCDWYVTR